VLEEGQTVPHFQLTKTRSGARASYFGAVFLSRQQIPPPDAAE
jgi:hypothetical protein